MWPVTASRTAYENRWIRVREDDVIGPDGKPGLYGVVEVLQPAVFIVALTAADEVLLVQMDRHTIGASLEIPAGGCDGQAPSDAAARELMEETGFKADDWQEIGQFASLTGVCRAPAHTYLARRLTEHAATGQIAEGIDAVRRVPWRDLGSMIRAGEIADAESITALAQVGVALGRSL